jgi:ppGpp synthetase/RelA/SpoT-type nucleotidyltranferase
MPPRKLPHAVKRQIDLAVDNYVRNRKEFERLATNLRNDLYANPDLANLVHSHTLRTKDPEHLAAKLARKASLSIAQSQPFDITADNLFQRIEDLAGLRLLHLHGSQMPDINRLIRTILDEHRYTLVRKPVAYTWDQEAADEFKAMGITPHHNPKSYTSVHYIIKANQKTDSRCELQVRTLMEELWGEVSHSLDYPEESDSRACREQLKALARLTSGCTRLVDAIYVCKAEHAERTR